MKIPQYAYKQKGTKDSETTMELTLTFPGPEAETGFDQLSHSPQEVGSPGLGMFKPSEPPFPGL